MATTAQLTRDMGELALAIDELRKATPTVGGVHVDRPMGDERKDDPGDGELNPDPVDPGLEDGIQDPFNYRDLNEDRMPREGKRDKKDEDDPGTQDVDPPNQADVDDAPLDVIVPQEDIGKYDPGQPRADDGEFGSGGSGRTYTRKETLAAFQIYQNETHSSRLATDNVWRNFEDIIQTKIESSPLNKDTVLYRGGTIPADVKVGDALQSRGTGFGVFTSASKSTYTAERFADKSKSDLVMRINAKAGQGAADVSKITGDTSESEFLLGRNVKFNVTGVSAPEVRQGQSYRYVDVIINSKISKLDAVTKTISGSSPISLNAKGVALANRLAERIAAKGCLDIMYSSTLPRGVETVQPILRACPRCLYAEATGDLVPWKLGAYEGREPKDVAAQITALVENPDEVPPGEGADGEPGESFNAGKARQLGFFKRVMQDWRDDPTLKIGVQVHSRGEDLFVAWVADGAPDDYDVDTRDVLDPDDQPHASVMRWAGKDKVKEVDLDSDDMLKGGVYLVLHSLTDDDGDDGNPELEKYEGQPRDDKGEFGAGVKLGVLQDMHDRLKDHAGRSPNPSHAAEESFQHGVAMLGDKARELAAHPAFNVKINRSGDKARGVVLNHVKLGDNMRRSVTESDKAWHTDLALSHFHDALLTMSRVLGSKWVGKSAGTHVVKRVYLPPIEVHRAAKSAWEAGMSVVGITEALAGSRGLDLAHVQAVADFFAASESVTASPTARNAYGGVNAVKWAAKVIAKSAKVWEPWVGVDLTTLCHVTVQ